VNIQEMAEAHLQNVEREIATLNERKAAIDIEIGKLAEYLKQGRATLLEASTTQKVVLNAPQNEAGSTVFNPGN